MTPAQAPCLRRMRRSGLSLGWSSTWRLQKQHRRLETKMATTAENRVGSDVKALQSYLGGKWQAGSGDGASPVDPTTGDIVASASSKGLDLKAALDYSRNVGGPALRKLSYGQRAELLGKVGD